jgi:hypothetical protein
VSPLVSTLGQLAEKARLSNSGLATQSHGTGWTTFYFIESTLEYAELVPASHESRLRCRHEPRVTRRTVNLVVTAGGGRRCVTDLSRRHADPGQGGAKAVVLMPRVCVGWRDASSRTLEGYQ